MDQEQTEMTSNEEKEEVTPEQQIVEQPLPSDEQTTPSEVNDSTSGKEKGDEQQQQGSEDTGQAASQVSAKEEGEKEPAAKPTDESSRKLRCVDPTGTIDIPMGNTGITANKPQTIPQFFTKTCETWPEVKALCWKDKKGDPWKSLTYREYKQLVYNVAKSFLKVVY